MADVQINLQYTIDLEAGENTAILKRSLLQGDKNAHQIVITAKRGRAAVDLTGATVNGYFVNSDGATVILTGRIENGAAVLVLTESCYAVVGRFNLVIKLTSDPVTNGVLRLIGSVERTRTDVLIDPGHVIPSLEALLAQIEVMEQAVAAADEATDNANGKAAEANAAAQAANTSAQAASAAAGSANTAAAAADAARDRLDNLTVTAHTLPAGSSAEGSITKTDTTINLDIGVPRGDTGATPNITIGTVTTGAPGTQAGADMTGTAEAPVLNLTIPRGDTGSLGTLTVNGKAPDAGGGVTLTADDVGALAIDGTAVNAAMLGGKAPEYYIRPRNLLRNSDFRNPVNQRGQNSYTSAWGKSIDGWYIGHADMANGGTCTLNIVDGGIELVNNHPSSGGIVMQTRIPPEEINQDAYHKFAWCDAENNIGIITATPEWIHHNINSFGFLPLIIETTAASVKLKWAVLYEGIYADDAVPPHVPKGYMAELLECQRYYQTYPQVGLTCRNNGYATMPLHVEMRAAPTITVGSRALYADSAADVSGTYANGLTAEKGYLLFYNGFHNGFVTITCTNVQLSAEL